MCRAAGRFRSGLTTKANTAASTWLKVKENNLSWFHENISDIPLFMWYLFCVDLWSMAFWSYSSLCSFVFLCRLILLLFYFVWNRIYFSLPDVKYSLIHKYNIKVWLTDHSCLEPSWDHRCIYFRQGIAFSISVWVIL